MKVKLSFCRCLIFIVALVLINLTFNHVYAINNNDLVNPTSDFYVADYANLLSRDVETHIINVNKSLNSQTGAQVVVVTINSLNGNSLEEYATALFRKFGIGDANKNNGVLLLISKGDRLSRIEVGYGLEGVLTDGKTGRIQDKYMIPYLKDNDWDNGIKNGFNAIVSEVAKEYSITIDNDIEPIEVENYEDGPMGAMFTITCWISMMFGTIIRK